MATEAQVAAKVNDNDEFYTRLEDIAAELCNYKKHFKDKVVFCNCDDPEWSNFWVYFHQNFSEFGLKKLISTHYNADGSPSYKMEYEGGNDADVKQWTQYSLNGNGDFRSEECVKILDEADIVVTNPPFSLFIPYVKLLIEHKKHFAIIGNINAVSYKEIFPLIKDGKIWAGYSFNKTMEMYMPDSYELKGRAYIDNVGRKHGFVPALAWYTNIDILKRHQCLIDELQYSYCKHPEWYPEYDNYNAINVGYMGGDKKLQKETNRTDHIPYDYFGIMGVPVSFLNKYNPDEFEIVGLGVGESNFTPTKKYQKFRNPKTKKFVSDKRDYVLYVRCEGGKYLTADDYTVSKCYARILIRRKQN